MGKSEKVGKEGEGELFPIEKKGKKEGNTWIYWYPQLTSGVRTYI